MRRSGIFPFDGTPTGSKRLLGSQPFWISCPTDPRHISPNIGGLIEPTWCLGETTGINVSLHRNEDEEVLQELKRSREEIGFLSEELQRVKAPQGLVGLLGSWKLANRQMQNPQKMAMCVAQLLFCLGKTGCDSNDLLILRRSNNLSKCKPASFCDSLFSQLLHN